MGYSNRSLRVRPRRQAGDTKVGGLLLDAAGIGQQQGRMHLQRQEVEISHGFRQNQVIIAMIQVEV